MVQVAGEAVKDLPSWANPDVIIAATLGKLDRIVAAASAEVSASCMLLVLYAEMRGHVACNVFLRRLLHWDDWTGMYSV